MSKIQWGEYVDMVELHKNNLKASTRSSQDRGRPAVALTCMYVLIMDVGQAGGQREVPDILSWVQCFGLYACVFSEAYPDKTRELWL